MSEYSHDEAMGALDALFEAEGPLQDGADDCLQVVRSYIDTVRAEGQALRALSYWASKGRDPKLYRSSSGYGKPIAVLRLSHPEREWHSDFHDHDNPWVAVVNTARTELRPLQDEPFVADRPDTVTTPEPEGGERG